MEHATYLKKFGMKRTKMYEYFGSKWVSGLSGRVLDAGCGQGLTLKFFDDGVGVDVDKDSIRYSKKSGLRVICSSIISLPFKNECFDAIFCNHILEHLEEKDIFKTLKEFQRVLKKNRICRIGFPDYNGYTKGIIKKDYWMGGEHKTLLTKKVVEDILSKNGWLVKNISIQEQPPKGFGFVVEHFPFLLPFLYLLGKIWTTRIKKYSYMFDAMKK